MTDERGQSTPSNFNQFQNRLQFLTGEALGEIAVLSSCVLRQVKIKHHVEGEAVLAVVKNGWAMNLLPPSLEVRDVMRSYIFYRFLPLKAHQYTPIPQVRICCTERFIDPEILSDSLRKYITPDLLDKVIEVEFMVSVVRSPGIIPLRMPLR